MGRVGLGRVKDVALDQDAVRLVHTVKGQGHFVEVVALHNDGALVAVEVEGAGVIRRIFNITGDDGAVPDGEILGVGRDLDGLVDCFLGHDFQTGQGHIVPEHGDQVLGGPSSVVNFSSAVDNGLSRLGIGDQRTVLLDALDRQVVRGNRQIPTGLSFHGIGVVRRNIILTRQNQNRISLLGGPNSGLEFLGIGHQNAAQLHGSSHVFVGVVVINDDVALGHPGDLLSRDVPAPVVAGSVHAVGALLCGSTLPAGGDGGAGTEAVAGDHSVIGGHVDVAGGIAHAVLGTVFCFGVGPGLAAGHLEVSGVSGDLHCLLPGGSTVPNAAQGHDDQVFQCYVVAGDINGVLAIDAVSINTGIELVGEAVEHGLVIRVSGLDGDVVLRDDKAGAIETGPARLIRGHIVLAGHDGHGAAVLEGGDGFLEVIIGRTIHDGNGFFGVRFDSTIFILGHAGGEVFLRHSLVKSAADNSDFGIARFVFTDIRGICCIVLKIAAGNGYGCIVFRIDAVAFAGQCAAGDGHLCAVHSFDCPGSRAVAGTGDFSARDIYPCLVLRGNSAAPGFNRSAGHIENHILLGLESSMLRINLCVSRNGNCGTLINLHGSATAIGVGQRTAGHGKLDAVRLAIVRDINRCAPSGFHLTIGDINRCAFSTNTHYAVFRADQFAAGNRDRAIFGIGVNVNRFLSGLNGSA